MGLLQVCKRLPGKMKFSLICLAVVAGFLAVEAVPCPYDACSCTEENIDCTNRGLTKLPPLNPGTFPQHDLDISGNKITSIGDGELPSNLQDIKSSGNPIATIGDHAFDGSKDTLLNIRIDGSTLTDLPTALNVLD